jgi:8-oxo-dGTP diphosphatase
MNNKRGGYKRPKNYSNKTFRHPSVTVDICICTILDNKLKVLLVKRRDDPFADHWATPGGFLEVGKKETLEQTAARELKEETFLEGIYLEQLKTYGDPERDPREDADGEGRVITVAYFALLPYDQIGQIKVDPTDIVCDVKEYHWYTLSDLPTDLAFDHETILKDLKTRLEGKILYTPIAFNFLPKYFTWKDLQSVYEAILGFKLVAPNFRRKINSQYIIARIPIMTIPASKKTHLKKTGRPSTLLKFEGIKENGY